MVRTANKAVFGHKRCLVMVFSLCIKLPLNYTRPENTDLLTRIEKHQRDDNKP